MFTGLIECVGTIERVERSAEGGRVLWVASSFPADSLALGDSVATSGVCLTVTALQGSRFRVDVGPETLERSTLGAMSPGRKVNLERSVTMGTRLGGHLVQGHVDAVGTITAIRRRENAWDYEVQAPSSVIGLTIPQGSVAIDGISLTVTSRTSSEFGVMIIPHTHAATTLSDRKVGDGVNLEVDLIARYVSGLLEARGLLGTGTATSERKSPGLTEAMLEANGFGRPK